jgi:hypothetical protein
VKVRIVCEKVWVDCSLWVALAMDAVEEGRVMCKAVAVKKSVALAGVEAMVKKAKWGIIK